MNDIELSQLVVKAARIAATLDAMEAAKKQMVEAAAKAEPRNGGYALCEYAVTRGYPQYAEGDTLPKVTRYVVVRKPKDFAASVAIPTFSDPWSGYETACACASALERDKKETAAAILAEMDKRGITDFAAELGCTAKVQSKTTKEPREGATPTEVKETTYMVKRIVTPIITAIEPIRD